MAVPVDLLETVDIGIHPLLLCLGQVPLVSPDSDGAQAGHLSKQLSVVVDSHQSALVGFVLLHAHQAVVSRVVLQVFAQVGNHASLPLVVD